MHFVKKILKVIVSGVLLWLFLKNLDWFSLVSILMQIRWIWFTPVFVLGPIGILLLAVRWRLLLIKLGLNISHIQAARGIWTGAFFNLFLLGTTGGDLYRLVFVRNLIPGSDNKITSSIILDRIFGVGSLLFLGIWGFIYKKHLMIQMLNEVGPVKISTFTIYTCFCVIFLILLFIILANAKSETWLGKFKDFVWSIGIQIIAEIKDPKLVFNSFVVSLAIHIVSFTSGYFISRAVGLHIDFIELGLFTSASAFILALPISINGLGLREALLVVFFQYNGYSCGINYGIKESAIIFSFVGVVCDFVRVIPGGLWFALVKESDTKKI